MTPHAAPVQVLVVDDDPNVLRALERVAMGSDFVLHCCSDVAAADRVASQVQLDIAVVDQHLGIGAPTGLDYLAKLHLHAPDCFRIIFTGDADLRFAVEAINRGDIDAFLLKPWSHEQLLAMLRQGGENNLLRRRNRELVEEVSSRNLELELFNDQLEEAVAERTRHLTLAHRRLEANQQELVRLETQGAVAQLVRGLAHELNNPLAAILGYAQRLQRRLRDDADAGGRLGVILSEVDRCRTLVEQLRNLAQPLDEEVVPCQPAEALHLAAERIREAGRPVPQLAQRSALPLVLAGPRALARVFEQVLDNAAQAHASRLWFSGEVSGETAVIWLENDGATPDDETVRHAVKPFYSTDPGRRGLGLAIAAALLREQGGTIALTTRIGGSGAAISIRLPAPAPVAATERGGADGSGERKVLVVDDEPLIAELLRDCLTEAGMRTVEVDTYEAALEHLRSEAVEAVLADVNLPDGSGIELLKRALAIQPGLGGHLALVTGDNAREHLDQLIAEHGFPILAKPFRLDQVHALMRAIL